MMRPHNGKMFKTDDIGNILVGVLVSGGYGAGWYSWNPENTDCLFEPEIVHIVEAYKNKALPQNIITEITTIAEGKWPDGYWDGAEGLEVFWLPFGTKFIVDEYDGNETLLTYDDIHWIEA